MSHHQTIRGWRTLLAILAILVLSGYAAMAADAPAKPALVQNPWGLWLVCMFLVPPVWLLVASIWSAFRGGWLVAILVGGFLCWLLEWLASGASTFLVVGFICEGWCVFRFWAQGTPGRMAVIALFTIYAGCASYTAFTPNWWWWIPMCPLVLVALVVAAAAWAGEQQRAMWR